MQACKMFYKSGNAISTKMTVFNFKAFVFCFAAIFHCIRTAAFLLYFLNKGDCGRF